MEYEDDKHIIRAGLWLRENEVHLLEEKVNDINNKDKEAENLVEENERLNNTIKTLKTEVFDGIMGFQGEDSFSLGSRTAYQIIYNRINELTNYGLKGSDK